MTFAKDSSGNWGYKVGGADPVIPFSKNADFYSALSVGKEVTVTCTDIQPDKYSTSTTYTFIVTYNNRSIAYLLEKAHGKAYNNVPSIGSYNSTIDNQLDFTNLYDGCITVNEKQYFGTVTAPTKTDIERYTTTENRIRDYPYPYRTTYKAHGFVSLDGSLGNKSKMINDNWNCTKYDYYYGMMVPAP